MTDKPRLRLYLFRHGQTEWALSGQHTGKTDIPLTPQGETEARELGDRLVPITFDQILVSPRERARHTCELAALKGAPPQVEPDLQEWDYGDYEGLTSAEIHQQRPDWNIFRDGCPNGESPDEVVARADRLLERLRPLHGNMGLFTHGQMGAIIAARWIEVDALHAQHLPLATASISMLGFAIHHPDVPVIALWNAGSESLPA